MYMIWSTAQQHPKTNYICQESLSIAEESCSNIEREALGILKGLKKFHCYCIARELSIITDHKPLIASFKGDIATLSQRLQYTVLRIHQYRIRMLYKPGIDLFMAAWLPWQNHEGNKDNEIPGMKINIDAMHTATDILEYCMSIQDIQWATIQDEHLQQIHHMRVAKKQKWNSTWAETVLDIKGWSCIDMCYNNERWVHHNVRKNAEAHWTNYTVTSWVLKTQGY